MILSGGLVPEDFPMKIIIISWIQMYPISLSLSLSIYIYIYTIRNYIQMRTWK